MTLVPFALLAVFSATTDRLGGARETPEVLPESGTRTGFQATRTTRWVRFNTPGCTRLNLSVLFARERRHAVKLPSVNHEVTWPQVDEELGRPLALTIDVDSPTFDLGLSVQEYTDVTMTWSRGPCEEAKAAPGTSPQWLDDVLASRPRVSHAQVMKRLENGGLTFEDTSAGDLLAYSAPVAFDGLTGSLMIDDGATDFSIGFETPADATGDELLAFHARLIGVLARLGTPRLIWSAASESAWLVKKGPYTVTLRLGESAPNLIFTRTPARG
jgi:hypothetical protein